MYIYNVKHFTKLFKKIFFSKSLANKFNKNFFIKMVYVPKTSHAFCYTIIRKIIKEIFMASNRIDRLNNVFVAGVTGSGKTNFLQRLLCDYLLENSLLEFKIAIVDEKGVDYNIYENLSVLYNEICTNLQSTKNLLSKILLELEQRKQAFNKVGAKDILEYNEITASGKLFSLVVFIDEIADLTSDKSCIKLFKQIIKDSFLFGIYFVVCTQQPSLLKNELQYFKYKVACRLISNKDSLLVIGDSGALKLQQGQTLVVNDKTITPQMVLVKYFSLSEQMDIIKFL